jgi:eukaryotic-like serine/threonine-protein kinase
MEANLSSVADRESLLGEILAALIEAEEAGQPLDRAEWLARHPGFAAELTEFFESEDRLDSVAAPLRAAVGLDTPGPAVTRSDGDGAAVVRVGQGFGDYELLAELGRGGMGVVYRARQKGANRVVALKLLRPDPLGTEEQARRFRNEAEIVAQLDHAGIVPLYEVGEQSGRVYFSMKLIPGGSLESQLDRFAADPRSAAQLMAAVARAVHHAHQRGVLHRDIKPANILLDGAGQPHVSDFGLARRVEGDSGLTQSGAIVGTPSYMAPEQTTGCKGAVTVAADVYGLGAVLYALLTGRAPFRADTPLDTLLLVREREPEAPGKVNPRVGCDLQAICLKCLEKEPARRYGSAEALAEDLESWLNGEPILARRSSFPRRAVKWIRRRPALTALLAVIALAVIGLLAGMLWHNAELREAAARERRLALAADRERQQADSARIQAVDSAADTRAFSEFLVNDVLAVSRPKGERGGLGINVTVKQALDVAAAKIGKRFRDRPRAEALARHGLGVTYRLIGEMDRSEEQLRLAYDLRRKTLGPDHEDTLDTGNSLAVLYQAQGRYARAEPLVVKALEASRRIRGEEHPYTLTFMSNLAGLYKEQDQFARAEPLATKALEIRRRTLGEEHPDTLDSMNNLAGLYRAQGRFARAEPLLVQGLEVSRRVLGKERPQTLAFMHGLGTLCTARGQHAKAEPLLAKALAGRRVVLGEEHPLTLHSVNALAELYEARRQFAKAEPLLVNALEARRRVLGEKHPDTLDCMNALAHLHYTRGQYAKAEPLLVNALKGYRRLRGGGHSKTLACLNGLAAVYLARGQYARVEPLLLKALEGSRRTVGEDHPGRIACMNCLALAYRGLGQCAKAEPLLIKALEGSRRTVGEGHPNTLAIMANLAGVYGAQGQFARAEPLYREALAKTRQGDGEPSPTTARALASLGANLLEQQKYADAEPLLRECLNIRERQLPYDWSTFNARSMLGASLLGQKRYADAEPLLLAGYEGIERREAKMPAPAKIRLTEALERLVQLYDAWGRKDRAEQWRKRLKSHRAANKM